MKKWSLALMSYHRFPEEGIVFLRLVMTPSEVQEKFFPSPQELQITVLLDGRGSGYCGSYNLTWTHYLVNLAQLTNVRQK